MNNGEAKKAVEEGLLVRHNRYGKPDKPYEGILKRLPDGRLWFEGQSGSETLTGRVKSRELFFATKEEKG